MILSPINLDGLVYSALAMLFGPALIFVTIDGILRYKGNKKAAKVFFILALIYLVISFGVSAVLMAS